MLFYFTLPYLTLPEGTGQEENSSVAGSAKINLDRFDNLVHPPLSHISLLY